VGRFLLGGALTTAYGCFRLPPRRTRAARSSSIRIAPGPGREQTCRRWRRLSSPPQVEVLGVTIVTGNQWRERKRFVHALWLLEVMGRSDIPVVPGAVFPLVRTRERKRCSGRNGTARVWVCGRVGQTAGIMIRIVVCLRPKEGPAHRQALHRGTPRIS